VKLIRESGGRADLLADFLVDFLTCLPVRVTDVVVEQGAIPLDDYPGGPRPTSTVTVSGGGRVGRGENVAFKESEHAAFVARARDFLVRAGGMGGGPCGVGAVMSALPPEASRYERAALEAALAHPCTTQPLDNCSNFDATAGNKLDADLKGIIATL